MKHILIGDYKYNLKTWCFLYFNYKYNLKFEIKLLPLTDTNHLIISNHVVLYCSLL
jgi:hypothetical protein